MSLFEYVIVLISVVLSFGIVRILEGHALLLRHDQPVKWSPTYLLWLVLIFGIHVDLWASLWMIKDTPTWTLPSLLLVLLAAMSLFYAAAFSAVAPEPGKPIDLWAFHLANHRRYCAAFTAYLALGAALNMTLLSGHFDLATATATGPGLALGLAATFVPNRWVQMVTPVLLLALIVVYFSQYFAVFHA